MVNLSSNNSNNINLSGQTQRNVNVSTPNTNNVDANTMGNSQRARSWAIGEGLIDGEDYSAKYYAQLAKVSEDIASSAIANIEEIEQQALDSIETGIGEIETAKEGALSLIDTTKDYAIDDVEDAESTALTNINTTTQTRITEIENTASDFEADLTLLTQRAETAATSAESSAINANSSATSADTSATAAATSATNASNSESNAQDSATAAATSASNANQSAISASNSASNAATSASSASTSATNAATSETNASNSAIAAATSEDNAEIWAEGTDEQVQALGGVHSSKGWSEISASGQINSDWAETDITSKAYILNKPTNYVTTDTAQDISGRKTFLGEKAIYFKQNAAADKLGFTLYNPSNTELGALEWRPNTINGNALLALNCPQSGSNYVGFRYWSNINIVAPRPTTNGNYFIPVNITDGTNTVTANNNGTLNISSLLPDVSDMATQTWVTNQGYTTNVGTVTSVNNIQPDASGNVTLTIPDTATWGNITGTLSDQTDLQTALNSKLVNSGDSSKHSLGIMGMISSLPSEATWIGYSSEATHWSIACGFQAQATGQYSIAIGWNAKSTSQNSIQIGYGTNSTSNTLSVGFNNTSYTLLNGTTGLIPYQRINSVTNNNSGNVKFWTGTQAEYDAITTKDADTLYYITDDSNPTLSMLELLYPVGSIYIGTMSACPLQTLGIGTWQLKTSRFLVEKKEPDSNDNRWYNLYSDGYCEQGGITTITLDGTSRIGYATPTFIKQFRDTNDISAFAQGGYIPGVSAMAYNVNNVTTSSMLIQAITVDRTSATSGTPNPCYYRVSGYTLQTSIVNQWERIS